ncbi:MAG: general secretion pathway protein GspK [Comamonadaceae bacterium]|nr:MAG: general secretion pathway protein GspK [Comamonadaceae bacterium]
MIATFAATALWQQWRATEIEAAERARLQSAWVLVGALDWARLWLREDRTDVDSLADLWAMPLEEARLSSFLAADKNVASDEMAGLPEAFLSGRIVDAQSKLNVRNLIDGGQPVEKAVAAFQKLFELLGLPPEQVMLMVNGLRRTAPQASAGTTASPSTPGTAGAVGTPGTPAAPATPEPAAAVAATPDTANDTPLMPQRVQQLVWFGLPASTVAVIAPYVTLLPNPTALNINTASAEALAASVPELDLAGAQRVVTRRQGGAFNAVSEANDLLPQENEKFSAGQHGVKSSYFETTGRLRLNQHWVEEQAMIERNGINLTVLWRERGAGATAALAAR